MKNRPRFGEKIALASALALLGFLFADWFAASVGGAGFEAPEGWTAYVFEPAGLSGWDSLGWFALGLCVLSIIVGVAVFAAFVVYESPVLPLAAAITATTIGTITVIALLVQVISQPGQDELVIVRSGWWLGLLAAAGVARGGFLSMRDEYLPGVPMPDVEMRSAPAA